MHRARSLASKNFQSVSARSFRTAWTLALSLGSAAFFLITVSSNRSPRYTSRRYYSRCCKPCNRQRTTTAQCSILRARLLGCLKLSQLARNQVDPFVLPHSRARRRPRSPGMPRVAEGTPPILLGLPQAAHKDHLALGIVLAALGHTPILSTLTETTSSFVLTGTSPASVSMPPETSRRCGGTARRSMSRTRRGRT
jgi:hypothetical protein